MASEIERLREYKDGESVYRTSCECMGDDTCTFSVRVDEEYAEYRKDISGMVYLEIDIEVHHDTWVWSKPAWSRGVRSFWNRIVSCWKLLRTGCLSYEAGFIFRGEEHMDEFCNTIQAAKERAKNAVEEKRNGIQQ